MPERLRPGDALIVVDVQNDFCPGGAVPVPEGNQVVGVLNNWIGRAEGTGVPVVMTRDWHPPDHCSFREQGGIWPAHCVQNTPGAAYHPDLERPGNAIVLDKGMTAARDAYSGFSESGLADELRARGVRRLWVGGLALDYCVKATVLDGVKEGFEVHVIRAATRAVDAKPGDGARALDEMRVAGARIEDP